MERDRELDRLKPEEENKKAIAQLNEKHELLPKAVTDKIMQRDATFIAVCHEAGQLSDEDDEYADSKVPDDMMW